MTKLTLEVILKDDTVEIYNQPYEVSDGNEIVYASALGAGPKLKKMFLDFIQTNYENKVDIVTTVFEFNSDVDGTTICNSGVISITATRKYVFGALTGIVGICMGIFWANLKRELGM